jgi:hypothetical protein
MAREKSGFQMAILVSPDILPEGKYGFTVFATEPCTYSAGKLVFFLDRVFRHSSIITSIGVVRPVL